MPRTTVAVHVWEALPSVVAGQGGRTWTYAELADVLGLRPHVLAPLLRSVAPLLPGLVVDVDRQARTVTLAVRPTSPLAAEPACTARRRGQRQQPRRTTRAARRRR